MRQNNQKHFKECMIQRLCESSMVSYLCFSGFMPGMINQADLSPAVLWSCTEAAQSAKAQKASKQNVGPDFPSHGRRTN
ncbi:hypothetical protein GQ457_16G015600 [Hibiscus cannabinus]